MSNDDGKTTPIQDAARAATTRATPGGVARLITRGLSGEHLWGFLPGNDHKEAISHAASGQHGWTAREANGWGYVTREGIGYFRDLGRRAPGDAIVFVTWREVLGVIERGCADGRREAYEAAFAVFGEWARAQRSHRIGSAPPPVDWSFYHRAHDGIRETTDAIIAHGCAAGPVQTTLF